EIPTVFVKGALKIRDAIIKENPHAVVSVGQAGGRDSISIEKIGINLKEARIPDNEGNQPFEQKIKADGDTAYFSSLPVKDMVQNVISHGIPSSLSFTAGTYVCNEVMYSVLYMLHKEF
ncbi:MAG: pyroglutamyl-peptidase I, partial [Oscillospiraceae bacterium]